MPHLVLVISNSLCFCADVLVLVDIGVFVVANFDYSALNCWRWVVASSIILITWLGIARKQQDQFLQSFQFCGKIWVGYYFDWYCCSMSVMGDVCISDVMIWCYFYFFLNCELILMYDLILNMDVLFLSRFMMLISMFSFECRVSETCNCC